MPTTITSRCGRRTSASTVRRSGSHRPLLVSSRTSVSAGLSPMSTAPPAPSAQRPGHDDSHADRRPASQRPSAARVTASAAIECDASPSTRRSAQRTGCSSSTSSVVALGVRDKPRGQAVVARRAALAQRRDRRVGRLGCARQAARSARSCQRACTRSAGQWPRARIARAVMPSTIVRLSSHRAAAAATRVVRNAGRLACGVPGRPASLARDAAAQALGLGLRGRRLVGAAAARRRTGPGGAPADRRRRRGARAGRARGRRARAAPRVEAPPALDGDLLGGPPRARVARVGQRPTPTSCAASAAGSTSRPTSSPARAASATSRPCSSGPAARTSRSCPMAAARASAAACSARSPRASTASSRWTSARWSRVLQIDDVSRAALIQAGATGPALERQLRALDLTLRFYPQSFELSTLGGWIATRAGGHFATVETHIDDLVESVRAITPASGAWESRRLPGSGAGPSPDRMLLGSEGILGVITEAWVRVRPRPQAHSLAAVRFADFARGIACAARDRPVGAAALQLPPDRRRGGAHDRRGRRHGGAARARLRGRGGGAAARRRAARPRARAVRRTRAAHGTRARVRRPASGRARRGAGDAVGAWRTAFFRAPYLRDAFVSMGILSETFESAITWERFDGLHAAVTAAAGEADRAGRAGDLPDLARLSRRPAPYFTVLAPARRGEELEQWAAGQARRVGGAARRGRDDHPPPRDRPRSPAVV